MEPELPPSFTVPLFPLPGIVLFPGMVLPLHIFEDRYRHLLRDALAGEKRIALGHLCPGWRSDYYGAPPVHDILGVGEIIAHKEQEDGTSNIALMGLARCRLQDEVQREPYRIAFVETLQEPVLSDVDVRTRHKTLLKTAERVLRRTVQAKSFHDLSAALRSRKELGQAADLLASIFVRDVDMRQQLLERLDALERAQMVQEVLDEVAEHLGPLPPPVTDQDGRYSLN